MDERTLSAEDSPRAVSTERGGRIEKALALVVLAWVVWRTFRVMQAAWIYTQDDAYITMRYARHLAEGHGISWNVGEPVPVEGYSNFLFVLLGAGVMKLGLDPIVALKLLSCAAVPATFVLLYVLARRWLGPLAATLPAVLLAAHPGLAYWAVSGLETTVFQLLVVAATTAFVVGLDRLASVPRPEGGLGWTRARLHTVAAALCFLAAVTRPEGPILVVVLGLTTLADAALGWRAARVAARRPLWRDLVVTARAFALAFVLPYAAYFLWRYVHFGRLLPNTVYCKSHFNQAGDPWDLVAKFWRDGKVFIVLALVQDPRKLDARALPLFLLPLAYVAILFGADPIIGQFSRHFLAALALLVVASGMGLANLATLLLVLIRRATRAFRAPTASTPWRAVGDGALVFACLALLARGQAWLALKPAVTALDPTEDCGGTHDLADHDDRWVLAPPQDLGWHAACYALRMDARADLGKYLDRKLSPDETFVIGDAGLAPYLARASVIDPFCLNSPELTRPPISYDRGRFIDTVFARAPSVIVVQSYRPDRLVVDPEAGFYPALVADDRFRTLYQRDPHAPVFHAPFDRSNYWVFVRSPSAPPRAASFPASVEFLTDVPTSGR